MTENKIFITNFNSDTGIAQITINDKSGINKIDPEFIELLKKTHLETLKINGLKGIIIDSGAKDFCVGADIDFIYSIKDKYGAKSFLEEMNSVLRKIELSPVPVVSLITGSALGGGYELVLASHRRFVLDHPKIKLGLPEVNHGIFPGAGGTQRLPRLIGLQNAVEYIVKGKVVSPQKALKIGMIEEIGPDKESLFKSAEKWILKNQDFKQPWDKKGFVFPGINPFSEDARNFFIISCAMLRKKTAGAYKGPELAITAIEEGSRVTFDRSLEIELRHFLDLFSQGQANDFIQTMWVHKKEVEQFRDDNSVKSHGFKKIGILGAGMMGRGLAFICAAAGYEVVVKDINNDILSKAEQYCDKTFEKIFKGKNKKDKSDFLNHIMFSIDSKDMKNCDLIIEAVLEDINLKHNITKEIEPFLNKNAVWASNTSAIPITALAETFSAKDRFIGLHFFSPAEKMQLLEIVMGKHTSDKTLNRCLAFSKELKKLPIVVNDGFGFFTTRVFLSYILEGAQLITEGHSPALIEWAARNAGMAVPPLQVFDEVSLNLIVHAVALKREFMEDFQLDGFDLVRMLVEQFGRIGKSVSKGFYDYDEKGKKLWSGLKELSIDVPTETGAEFIKNRLLLIQCAETANVIEAGVIKNNRDVDIGAVFGIGFAPNTGGPLAYMDRTGIKNIVILLNEFSDKFGARYKPCKLLVDMAENNKSFFKKG